MAAPTSAQAVANEFLDLQASDPGHPPIDQMKIQKLVFYAHAWYLGINKAPLFDEDVYAWPWGPVVPPIYSDFQSFGRHPISGRKSTKLSVVSEGGVQKIRFVTPEVQDPSVKEFLRQVWDSHKGYTGVQLSNATHAPGEPWTVVLGQYGNLDKKPQIPNELIAEIFAQKVANEAAKGAGA